MDLFNEGAQHTETDAVVFVISAYSISKATLTRLETAALAAAPGPAWLVRLEDVSAPPVTDILTQVHAKGHRRIRVQPFGYPFSESLLAWLPGVLADWRRTHPQAQVYMGPDPATDDAALRAGAAATLHHPVPAQSVEHVTPRLGKPGWDTPPDFDFHLLVCTGPRCAIHGAVPFVPMLKHELKIAKVFDRCLTTQTGCIFPCNRGPVLALYPHGHWYRLPDRAAIRRFIHDVLIAGGTAPDLKFHTARAARADTTLEKEISQ